MGALDGEVAVVTGARHGIGGAIAQALADAGARVAVTHHDVAVAETGAGGDRAGARRASRSTSARPRPSTPPRPQSRERLGEPTVLVNSAGDQQDRPVGDVQRRGLGGRARRRTSPASSAAAARSARACSRPGGAASSTSARSSAPRSGCPGRAPYGASKAAIVGLTRVLGVEWAGAASASTPSSPAPCARRWSRRRSQRRARRAGSRSTARPAGRFAEPEDIATGGRPALQPVTRGFVTAQTLVVDGGFSMYGAAPPATRLPGHPSDDA